MHNTFFWTKFLRTLQFELSEGLVFRGQRRNEEVCYKLLAPLLGRVAHSTSQLPVPQDSGLEGIVLYLISQLRSAYRRSRKSTGGGDGRRLISLCQHMSTVTPFTAYQWKQSRSWRQETFGVPGNTELSGDHEEIHQCGYAGG